MLETNVASPLLCADIVRVVAVFTGQSELYPVASNENDVGSSSCWTFTPAETCTNTDICDHTANHDVAAAADDADDVESNMKNQFVTYTKDLARFTKKKNYHELTPIVMDLLLTLTRLTSKMPESQPNYSRRLLGAKSVGRKQVKRWVCSALHHMAPALEQWDWAWSDTILSSSPSSSSSES